MSRTFYILLLLGIIILQTGCALFRPSEVDGSVSSSELSPEVAAKACLATARELAKKGDEEIAIVQYEKAREYNPKLTGISPALARLYDRQGHDARALAEYHKALATHPNDADLLNDLGFFHYQREQFAEAEDWLRKALAKDAKHQRARNNLGMTLAKQGRYPEALEEFQKVGNKPAVAYHNVGVVMAHRGHIEQARRAFEQALALDPTLRQSRELLATINERTDAQLVNSNLD